MNEDFIKDLYDIYKTKYQDIKDNDVNYFKNLLQQSEEFRNDVYKEQSKNWSDLTPDLYNELIGVKKKDASVSVGQESTSKSPLGETIGERIEEGDKVNQEVAKWTDDLAKEATARLSTSDMTVKKPAISTSIKPKTMSDLWDTAKDSVAKEQRLKDRSEFISKSISDLDSKLKESRIEYDKIKSSTPLIGFSEEQQEAVSKMKSLESSMRGMLSAKDVLEKFKDYEKSPNTFWSGIKNSDWNDILSAGLESVIDASEMYKISEKMKAGEVLSEEDQMRLTAEHLLQQLQSEKPESFGYGTAKMLTGMIPFITQLYATGGAGTVIKKGIVESAKLGTRAYLKRLPKDLLKQAAFDAPRVAAMPMFYSETIKNATPDLTSDADGNIKFEEGTEDTPVKAVAKSFLTTFGERYFEGFGGVFDKALYPTVKSIGTKIGFDALFSGKSKYTGILNEFRKTVGVNNPIGELIEEDLNGLYAPLVSDDRKFSDTFNWKTQGQILVSSAIMNGVFKLAELPSRAADYAKITAPYNKARERLVSVFGEDANAIIEANNSDDIQKRTEAMSKVSGLAKTEEQKVAMLDYFTRKIHYDMLDGALEQQARTTGGDTIVIEGKEFRSQKQADGSHLILLEQKEDAKIIEANIDRSKYDVIPVTEELSTDSPEFLIDNANENIIGFRVIPKPEDEIKYDSFSGNVQATISNNRQDAEFALEELTDLINNKKTTLSDKTIDMLATLGAVTTPKDMVDVFRSKDKQKQIVNDLTNALNEKQMRVEETQTQSQEEIVNEQEAQAQEPVVDQKQPETPPVDEQPTVNTGSQPTSQSEMPSGVSSVVNESSSTAAQTTPRSKDEVVRDYILNSSVEDLSRLPERIEGDRGNRAYKIYNTIDWNDKNDITNKFSQISEIVNAKWVPNDRLHEYLDTRKKFLGSEDIWSKEYIGKWIATTTKDFTGISEDVQQNAPFISTEQPQSGEQATPLINETITTETTTNTGLEATENINTEPPVSTEPATEPNRKTRKTVKDLQESPVPSDKLKQRAEEYKYYTPTSEKEVMAEVDKIIESGLDYAYSLATELSDKVHHSVLPRLRERLMDEYEKLSIGAEANGDAKLADDYMDKAVEVDRLYSEEGTVWAQTLQAYSTRSKRLNLHRIRRQVERNRDETLRDNKQNIDDLFTALRDANSNIIEALRKEGLLEKIVEDYLRNTPPSRLTRADRIKKEKAYRSKLFDDFKNRGSSNVQSMGSFISDAHVVLYAKVLASYVRQGIVEVSELLKNLKRDVKLNLGQDLTKQDIDFIKENVKVDGKSLSQIEAEGVIDSDKFSQFANKKLSEAIKEIGLKISDVAVKHFSEVDKTGRSLADKIVDSLGISGEQATKLANRIQAKFLTEVAKKKMELLEKIDKPKTVKERKVKGLYDKLVEFSNLGAFNKEQFKQAYADALGLPKMTAEQAGEINKYLEQIKEASGLRSQELTLDMLGYIRKNVNGLNKYELAGEMAVANMLSGIPTQERNLSYNFASYVLNALPGQIIDLIQAQKTGTGNNSLFFKSQAKAFRQGLREAAYVLKTGKYIRPGKDIQAPQLLELTKFGKYSGLRYVGRVMQAVDMAFAVPLEEMNALYVARGLAQKENKPVEDVLSQSQAQVRDAKAQAAKEGYTTSGASNNIRYWKRVYEILSEQRPDELNKEASEFGDFITGKSKPFGTLGAIGDKVSQAVGLLNVKGYPVGKLFLSPFIRAITNFMQLSLDYNPMINAVRLYKGGYGKESIPAMKQYNKKFTEYEYAQEYAKLAVSLLTVATIIGLTFDDEDDKWFDVTGTSTGDPERDKQLRNEGRMEVALKFGDKYISMKYTPLATVIAPLGYVRDYMKYRSDDLPESEIKKGLKMSWLIAMASMKVAAESSAFANIEGLLSTLFSGEKEYERNVEQFAQGIARTAGAASIPYYNLLNSLERFNRTVNDLPMRQADTWYGKIVKDLPVVGNNVSKPMLNVLGDPITTNWDVIWDTATGDEFLSPLSRNNIFLSKPSKNTKILDRATGEERVMTEDELYDFALLTGQKVKKFMMDNMDQIKRLDEAENEKDLKKMVEKATVKARELSKAQLSSGLKIEGLNEFFSNVQTLAQSEYFLDDYLKASNDPKATKKYGKETRLYEKASYFKENFNDIEMLRKAVDYVLGSDKLEYVQETADFLSSELSKFNDRVKSGRTYQVSNKVLKIVEDNDLMKNEDNMARRENMMDLY